MITITEKNDIAAAFEKFTSLVPGGQAYATCRVLEGDYLRNNYQEWEEHGTINGVPALVVWLIPNEVCEVEDAGDIPFDDEDYISRIELSEVDCTTCDGTGTRKPIGISYHHDMPEIHMSHHHVNDEDILWAITQVHLLFTGFSVFQTDRVVNIRLQRNNPNSTTVLLDVLGKRFNVMNLDA